MTYKIWLTDLTYTQQTIASDTIPGAVSMIAEYVSKEFHKQIEFEIFKFPEELIKAFNNHCPDIFGCSNYVWNSSLSLLFCKRIKELYPKVITVMGGPNFPSVYHEMEGFVRKHYWVDFFIMKEGEFPFLQLVKYLNGEDANLSNIVFLDRDNDMVVFPEHFERVVDLDYIPSPYLSGRLDKFLDGRLVPVIQINRGCPFFCTFCTEGQSYWNKVRKKRPELVAEEIRYISKAMNKLDSDKRRSDLLIADSNFGMYKGDIQVCHAIANEQKKHGYPGYINVSTGKNNKKRVLEAAGLVNGAIKLAGSVQSLDSEVLENIKRTNISSEQIVDLALNASEIGANTYSEVILGLPGDSLKAHFYSLQELVEADFNTVVTYQLMILPGTEMGLQATKDKYKMVCKYRIQPRCFGVYDILGQQSPVAEIEEICVENNTLPYADYLRCRKMHFVINLFYNDGVFFELRKLLTILNISCWEWLYDIYNNFYSKEFHKLMNDFVSETENELWDNKSELDEYVTNEEVIKKFINGEEGNNLLFRFKAISLTTMFTVLCKVAKESIMSIIHKNNICIVDGVSIPDLVEDIITYKIAQIDKIFLEERAHVVYKFKYDIFLLHSSLAKNTDVPLFSLKFTEPKTIEFKHNNQQLMLIRSYIKLFGSDIKGVARILTRVFLKQLYRQPILDRVS